MPSIDVHDVRRNSLTRPQTVHVVVNATNRKRLYPSLNLGDFNSLNGESLFGAWFTALDSCRGDRVAALDLYAGDHWCVAKSLMSAFSTLAIRLWVISPGYGLIRAEEHINPYIATFSPDHYESVCRGSDMELHQANRNWWNELMDWQPRGLHMPRSIYELHTTYSNDSIIIVCSTRYLNLLQDDLANLGQSNDVDLSRFHIASSRGSKSLGNLAENLVPSGRKLLSVTGGGDASLNIRTAKIVLGLIDQGITDGAELRCQIRVMLANIPENPRLNRRHVTDDEVCDFIAKTLHEKKDISIASCLRRYRESNHACGEKRFRRLFGFTRGESLS